MKLFPKRADKLATLSKLIEGRLTDRDITDLRKSLEPVYITLNLGDDNSPTSTDNPTYHIQVSDDWTQSRCYWQYADGLIVEIS